MTATVGTWNPGATRSPAFHRAGREASTSPGRRHSTYTPVAGDVGKTVVVRVTASKTGYANASATSSATTAVVAGTISNVTAPAITGTAKVGQVLSASAGTWNPSDVTVDYQWVAGGVDISGATARPTLPARATWGRPSRSGSRPPSPATATPARAGRDRSRGGRDDHQRHGADDQRHGEGRGHAHRWCGDLEPG